MTRSPVIAPPVISLAISEADFQHLIITVAQRRGWLVQHSRTVLADGTWQTPIRGNKGFPDLVLARDEVVLVRELKTEKGSLSTEQAAWLRALGPLACVWRPRDWPQIYTTLTAPRARPLHAVASPAGSVPRQRQAGREGHGAPRHGSHRPRRRPTRGSDNGENNQ